MKIERSRPPVLQVRLGAYEMASLMAAARWAVEGREGDLNAEAREQLQQVLESYEGEMQRLRGPKDGTRREALSEGKEVSNEGEAIMARKYIDCREIPSETDCSLTISADSEDELLEAAAHHAVQVHGHEDTPELRDQLRGAFKTGTPPKAPASGGDLQNTARPG